MDWLSSQDPITLWTYAMMGIVNDQGMDNLTYWNNALNSFSDLFGVTVDDLAAVYESYAAANSTEVVELAQPL